MLGGQNLINFVELEDRFEAEFEVGRFSVTFSVDKPIVAAELDRLTLIIRSQGPKLLELSLEYFEKEKLNHGLAYIDDLSDPQIMGGQDGISVYWCSAKGESRAESTIGIDFDIDKLQPLSLSVGD